LIEAGEPLGTRYHVVKSVADLRPGMLIDVTDKSGAQLCGQLLSATSVSPQMAAEIRQAVTSLPTKPFLQRPRDLALTSQALPMALIERTGGVCVAATRIDEVVAAFETREAVSWLFRQVASVANDLAQVHDVGVMHGAITSSMFLFAATGDAGNLQLSGFGIEPFARSNDPLRAPARRTDLVALLNALHDLFNAAGLSPDGGAAAKWLLLRTSAQHGEHPALASGTSLAAALNEMASMRPDDVRSSVRAPTISGPRASASRALPSSSVARSSSATGTTPTAERSSAARLPGRSATRQESGTVSAPPRSAIQLSVVLPVVLLIAAIVGGGVWYAIHVARDVGVAHINSLPVRTTPTPSARCQGEDTRALGGIADFTTPSEFGAVCVQGTDRLALVARKGTAVTFVSRPAQRGQRYTEALSLGEGAVELGNVLVRDGVTWVIWRNGVGDPFTVARIEGDRVAKIPVRLAGSDLVPLRGAWLLDVNASGLWIATQVLNEGGERVLLLQVTLGPSAPEVTPWVASQGIMESYIPGQTPTLLVSQRAANNAIHLTAVTFTLATVALARHRPVADVSIPGTALPDGVSVRSRPHTMTAGAVGAAPRGVVRENATAWLVGHGGMRSTEQCVVPQQCHTAGPVELLLLGDDAPVATSVIPSGWAVEMAANEGNTLSLAVTPANVAGMEVYFHSVYTLPSTGQTLTAGHVNLATWRSSRMQTVRCGTESWVVFDATQPTSTLSALPFGCLTTQ
jgi:hypothetical protein